MGKQQDIYCTGTSSCGSTKTPCLVYVGGKTSGKNTLENQRDRAFPNRNDLEWYLVGPTEGPHSSRIGAFHSRHPMLGLKAWVLNPYRVDVISKAW